MRLLVSDANILIDMEEGGLLLSMFSLECKFITPNILYYEELSRHHAGLLDPGLEPRPLTPESMSRAFDLARIYRRPSRNGLLAVALAGQESCSLLTGDKHLRTAAQSEGITVFGTIRLVEKLLDDGKISADAARAAYEAMRRAGSRLPWGIATHGLKNICDLFDPSPQKDRAPHHQGAQGSPAPSPNSRPVGGMRAPGCAPALPKSPLLLLHPMLIRRDRMAA